MMAAACDWKVLEETGKKRNAVVLDIVRATARYTGCPPEEILDCGRGTMMAKRARVLAYAAAEADVRLSAMSAAELSVQMGKYRRWASRSMKSRMARKLEGTEWWARGMAYVRKAVVK